MTPANGGLLLFGGLSAAGVPVTLGETWTWDGLVWRQRDVPGPPARLGPVMVTP